MELKGIYLPEITHNNMNILFIFCKTLMQKAAMVAISESDPESRFQTADRSGCTSVSGTNLRTGY